MSAADSSHGYVHPSSFSDRIPDKAHEPILNIGQLLSHLTDEFPDITASKVRFWEEKGLITPQRTSTGYRKYAPIDVDRIRFILKAQRDKFLPLKVIKESLDSIDAGEDPSALGSAVPAFFQDSSGQTISLNTLREKTHASQELIRTLLSSKLLVPIQTKDGSILYPQESIGIVNAAVQLQELGIEPRHLHIFRTFIEREMALLERAVTSQRGKHPHAAELQIQESYRNLHNSLLRAHSRFQQ